jgi:hypothetical protein
VSIAARAVHATRPPDASTPETSTGDRIDRLAALYQRARLWKRRAQSVLAEAADEGSAPACHAALVRYRRARHWEATLRELYLRAVLAEYH